MSPVARIGIMRTPIEHTDDEAFRRVVDRAVAALQRGVVDQLDVEARVLDFVGPHLTPTGGTYAPLDFVQIGMTERLERDLDFLLVVTEVDLSPERRTYVLALPSETTNVAVVSTRRLDPTFWGHEPDDAVTVRRLSALLLHTLGHLLGLRHHPDPANAMHDFVTLEELEQLSSMTPEQVERARRSLPEEMSEQVATSGKVRFALRQVWRNRASIARSLRRAHPLRLLGRMPTMATAALSVTIVLFFSAEMWDIGSSVAATPLILFSVLAVAIAVGLLYGSFRLRSRHIRRRGLAESTVVTAASTLLALSAAIVVFYAIAFGLALLSALTFFPEALKSSWPTVDPAGRLAEQVNLALFLAAMAVLSGSLGGSADSKRVIRYVLFLDEES